jgi:hypothetical protein
LVLKYFFKLASLSVLIATFPGGRASPDSLELYYLSWQQLEISWTQRGFVSQEGQSLDTESGGIFSLVGSQWWGLWVFIMSPQCKWQQGGGSPRGLKNSSMLSLYNSKFPEWTSSGDERQNCCVYF